MNVSEAVQVFVLIYVLVIAALYLSSRFWSPLLARCRRFLGLAPRGVPALEPIAGDGPSSPSHSFRPGAPRPPKLRHPPVIEPDAPEFRRAYCRRLGIATRLIGYVGSANPTGFPLGLFREWHEARWQTYCDDPAIGSEQAISEALGLPVDGEAEFSSLIDELVASGSYSEMSDLVHFCGEAFAASKSGSDVRGRISVLADRLAVAVCSDVGSVLEEHDLIQLERKLEVDFMGDAPSKVAHLRRMHAFFRGRLIALRDHPGAERRQERMSDCRGHMEEHERLLACFGFAP